jgi:hypothetical protein
MMHELKLRIFILSAVAVALAAPTPALAAYRWMTDDITYTGTVQYNGTSRSITYDEYDKSDPFGPIVNARDSLYSSLRSSLYNAVGSEASTASQYRWHASNLTGPLDLKLVGIPGTSASSVTLSGPTASFQVHFKQVNFAIVVTECDLYVNTGPITLTDGRLDAALGTLTGLRLSNFSPTHSESCSSSIGWIPVIGNLWDDLANHLFGGLVDRVFDKAMDMSSQVLQPSTFVGLNAAIPVGKFMIDNFDVGAYLRDNLGNLFSQNTISVHFAEVSPQNTPKSGGDVFSLGFTQPNLSFSLTETFYREYEWYCPGPRRCELP